MTATAPFIRYADVEPPAGMSLATAEAIRKAEADLAAGTGAHLIVTALKGEELTAANLVDGDTLDWNQWDLLGLERLQVSAPDEFVAILADYKIPRHLLQGEPEVAYLRLERNIEGLNTDWWEIDGHGNMLISLREWVETPEGGPRHLLLDHAIALLAVKARNAQLLLAERYAARR